MQDYEIAARDLRALIGQIGLTVECTFLPFSQSRNAGEKSPSLNWRARVMLNGKPVSGLESVDYMQGCGHAPASKAGPRRFFDKADLSRAISLECETGRRAKPGYGKPPYMGRDAGDIIPAPDACDIIAALCRDSDVLNYASFDQWADEFGFDADSRKAEAMYRACLATALAMRAAIGDDKLAELQNLANQL